MANTRKYQTDFRSRSEYAREWRKNNPGKQVAYTRKYRFGLTPLDIYTLRKMQNNRCAICGEEETRVLNGVAKDLCIDHDHETGKVRGLLCGHCNVMIGNARDRTDNLQRAIAYLEQR